MKQPEEKCAKPTPPPKPNFKNKAFMKWSRSETCKKEDNIVSTDWHETLKTIDPFVPAYDNAPLCMNYLLSGEYGRIWQKERDDWFKTVFVPKGRDKDMAERRLRIQREARAAKKKAEKEAKERKERKAKEAEAKARLEAEKAEKLKAKLQKCAALKKAEPQKKKKKDAGADAKEATEPKKETCPKNWVPVELTVQCECSSHKNETSDAEQKQEPEPNLSEKAQDREVDRDAEPGCVMCGDYIQQIKNAQSAKSDAEEGQRDQSPNPENENQTSAP